MSATSHTTVAQMKKAAERTKAELDKLGSGTATDAEVDAMLDEVFGPAASPEETPQS